MGRQGIRFVPREDVAGLQTDNVGCSHGHHRTFSLRFADGIHAELAWCRPRRGKGDIRFRTFQCSRRCGLRNRSGRFLHLGGASGVTREAVTAVAAEVIARACGVAGKTTAETTFAAETALTSVGAEIGLSRYAVTGVAGEIIFAGVSSNGRAIGETITFTRFPVLGLPSAKSQHTETERNPDDQGGPRLAPIALGLRPLSFIALSPFQRVPRKSSVAP